MPGTVFARAAEPAYVMDPGTDRILAANDAGCRLLGLPAPGTARDADLANPPERASGAGASCWSVSSAERASAIRLTCRTKQGTFLPTEISLHAPLARRRLRILGLVQDRSEHRHRAARLRHAHRSGS